MLNRSVWPPGTSHKREVAKSGFSVLAPEIRGSYFASNAPSRLRPTHRTPVTDHVLSEMSESGALHSAVLLKMPGLDPKRAAVLRRGTAVAVPLLRLPWYSLRSYPFPFFFFQEEKRRRRAALELPRHTFRPGNLPADQEIMLTTEVSV
jgi:hypothetical protein